MDKEKNTGIDQNLDAKVNPKSTNYYDTADEPAEKDVVNGVDAGNGASGHAPRRVDNGSKAKKVGIAAAGAGVVGVGAVAYAIGGHGAADEGIEIVGDENVDEIEIVPFTAVGQQMDVQPQVIHHDVDYTSPHIPVHGNAHTPAADALTDAAAEDTSDAIAQAAQHQQIIDASLHDDVIVSDDDLAVADNDAIVNNDMLVDPPMPVDDMLPPQDESLNDDMLV